MSVCQNWAELLPHTYKYYSNIKVIKPWNHQGAFAVALFVLELCNTLFTFCIMHTRIELLNT